MHTNAKPLFGYPGVNKMSILKYSIYVTDQQLVISRNRRLDIFALVGISTAAVLLIGFIFFRIPGHYNAPIDYRLSLVLVLLLCFAFLWRIISVLREPLLTFDRVLGQVFFNDRPVYAMAELQSICLDQSYYNHTASLVLYLCTKSQGKMEITRDGLYGPGEPEMRGMAEAIARFAAINLVTPNGFIPGRQKKARKLYRKALLRRTGIRSQTPNRKPVNDRNTHA